jgi:prepilin-type N-terminal cleavage/methylation domain-containing protein
MMKALIERGRGDERGVTLVEMMLTMLILSIVLLTAFDFLDRTSMLTLRADAHGQAEHEVQTAMRTLSQNVRSAAAIGDPCTAATDTPPPNHSALPAGYTNCLRFTVPRTTTALDTCAKTEFVYALVTVTSNNKTTRRLVENRQEFTGTAASCTAGTPRKRRTLVSDIANTTTPPQPLFTYLAANGAVISAADTAAVKKAIAVRMTLAVKYRQAAPPLVLTSSATLRNVR